MADTITQDMIDDVRNTLKTVYEITREAHSDRKMIFYVMPKLSTSSAQIMETKNKLADKYGNPPFSMWQELDPYRITLGLN